MVTFWPNPIWSHVPCHICVSLFSGYGSFFAKLPAAKWETFGIEYDYLSIMHIPSQVGAKKGKESITTLNPKYQKLIGKSNQLSGLVVDFINYFSGKFSAVGNVKMTYILRNQKN